MFTKVIGTAAIAGAMLATAPAQAGTLVLTSSTNSSDWDATKVGTSWSMGTVDGATVTASAWSTSSLTASPVAAYLGRYQNGLGVTNASTDGSHTIDNVGYYDFVMLTFSKAVRLTDISRYGYDVDGSPNTISTDAWISYGSSAFNTSTLWDGYINRGVNVGATLGGVSNNFGTVWLVGAARTATSRDDGFKLTSITVTTVPAVPEPATWMMMILGFGAVGATLRRRRAAARVTFA
ncbi:PEPxxWA-CTERM sorting domain-containing protein [Sphingomonas sp. RS2018]